jgi:hypothetical protein
MRTPEEQIKLLCADSYDDGTHNVWVDRFAMHFAFGQYKLVCGRVEGIGETPAEAFKNMSDNAANEEYEPIPF